MKEDKKIKELEEGAIQYFQNKFSLTYKQARLFIALDSLHTDCQYLSQCLQSSPSAISRMGWKLLEKGLAEREYLDKVEYYVSPKGKQELDLYFYGESKQSRKYINAWDLVKPRTEEEIFN